MCDYNLFLYIFSVHFGKSLQKTRVKLQTLLKIYIFNKKNQIELHI